MTLFFALALACAKDPTPTAPPPPPPITTTAPVNAPPPADTDTPTFLTPSKPPTGPVDPQALYASCKDRVEGKATPGECKKDADCAKAGCSKEVCVSTANAADLTTSCDVEPCFQVLKTCGCVQGECTWTVGAP